ncbi:methionyl-tRNA ligase [Nitritalea halalkaliphila LW7]|uniref:Methionine--tRNA ligase n=1 Tax=Nitritalea halalkaliphila LW7 TaxID=1189621 RepID=I5C971_9BACT|nr:methionyl-tRNA ligase [Nitritalea halalkaliphila LW7]
MAAGSPVQQPGLLFEKIEDKVVEAQVQRLLDAKKANALQEQPAAPMKEITSFEAFSQMDLRVVTVLRAEKMLKSKKLLKLQVDTGLGDRTVLSGVAEHFSAEELVGRQVVMLLNLAPRKMMGIDSEGMILMAEDKDGTLRLLQPHEAVAPGAVIS